MTVHQHDVKAGGRQFLQRLLAVPGADCLDAQLLQDRKRDLLVDRIVFDQQQPRDVQGSAIDLLDLRQGRGRNHLQAPRRVQVIGDQRDQAGMQLCLPYGFTEPGDTAIRRALGRRRGHDRPDHQRRSIREFGPPARDGQHFDAVLIWHLGVENEGVELPAKRGIEDLERLATGAGLGHLGAPPDQLLPQDATLIGAVIHQQQPHAAQCRDLLGLPCRLRCGRQREREVEPRALARLAAHPDGAPHQFDQLFGDRQPQTGATVLAGGGGILLDEGFENGGAVLGSDTDAGVGDLESHCRVEQVVRRGMHRHPHLTALRELHRVADQVEKDLP